MTEQLTPDPRRTAVLVMDYQVGFVQRLADADRLLDRVSAAVGTVRARGGYVGWVRVGFDPAEFDAIPEASVMAGMTAPERRPHLLADAAATQLHDSLPSRPHDITVRKTRVGAFSTTDLDEQLRTRGVDTIVLAGITTSGVVLSTVRDAVDRDYRIVVLRDACADFDPPAHAFLMDTIFPKHATVIDVDDLTTWSRTIVAPGG